MGHREPLVARLYTDFCSALQRDLSVHLEPLTAERIRGGLGPAAAIYPIRSIRGFPNARSEVLPCLKPLTRVSSRAPKPTPRLARWPASPWPVRSAHIQSRTARPTDGSGHGQQAHGRPGHGQPAHGRPGHRTSRLTDGPVVDGPVVAPGPQASRRRHRGWYRLISPVAVVAAAGSWSARPG